MKTNLFLVIIIMCSFNQLVAQNPESQYGKVSLTDFEFTAYPDKNSPEAVVVFDVGSSSFSRNNDYFEVIYDRKTRIKVFNESGAKWAKVEIPFYHEKWILNSLNITERIFEIEACAYNDENGQFTKTKLEPTDFLDEKINDSWIVRKFKIPNVKAGTIIEYHYKLSSEFKPNFRSWQFQWEIPVLYSKYTTRMIPFYQYVWNLQGATKFDSQTSFVDYTSERKFGNTNFNDVVYEYVMKNIPAFTDNELITIPDDYLIKINFQLSKVMEQNGTSQNLNITWPELINDLTRADNFGGYIQKTEKLAKNLFDLRAISSKSNRQKFDTIMNYVKSNFSWNGLDEKYTFKTPKDFNKDRSGNAAEMNLFAVGLLKACGIKAFPVLLSTRTHGKVKREYPNAQALNYVCILADIDGINVLSDATDPLMLNNRIPIKCLNDQGLVIQNEKVEWVLMQSVNPSIQQVNVFQTLEENNQSSKVEITSTEYFALEARKEMENNIQKSLAQKGYKIVDSTIVIKNSNNINQPYIIKYQLSDKPEYVNEKFLISPFLKETITDNPLKKHSRTYPLDLIYCNKRSYYAEISIPKDYKVELLPDNEKIKNDQFELEYFTTTDENKIKVTLNYYFKLPVYDAEDYLKLKYYYKEIIAKGSEKIILVKK